jgi:hypothetical protein
MVSIRIIKVERVQTQLNVNIAVIDPLLDGGIPATFSYQTSVFVGMTRAQIRTFIINDLKSKYQPLPSTDATDTSGFTSSEVIDLGA